MTQFSNAPIASAASPAAAASALSQSNQATAQESQGDLTPKVEAKIEDEGRTAANAMQEDEDDGHNDENTVEANQDAAAIARQSSPFFQQPVSDQPYLAVMQNGLQMSAPWVAGALYGVIPEGPLALVADRGEKWYAITKGKYIGVTNSGAVADHAVTRVSHALRICYDSQSEAVSAFNDALAFPVGGLVAIV
ncbi:hypothetical protein DFH06DRAFT_1144833 [Mycena polygramma]|nr:hypothetical protein DFH06DRAFT_1144833 [Mycena polygramma]